MLNIEDKKVFCGTAPMPGDDLNPVSSPALDQMPDAISHGVVTPAPEDIASEKKPRVFMENTEGDLGLLLCGDLHSPDLHKGIGHLVESDLDGLVEGDSAIFVVRIMNMTDEEVENLPDV